MNPDFLTHKGTFLLYPSRKDVWRKNAEPIAETVKALAGVISKYERVILGVLPDYVSTVQSKVCREIVVAEMQYNDIWIRDSGAVPCGEHLIKFGFNAWGGEDGLYGDWSLDETVPEQMSNLLGMRLITAPLVTEGGNLVTNGKGTLVAVRPTICNLNRNPDISNKDVERILEEYLDVRKIIWLEQGLAFDETGGHVDNMCAFADESTVLLAWTDDPRHPQYEAVRKAYAVFEKERGAFGEKFDVVKVPLPMPFQRLEEDCVGLEYAERSKERLPGELIQPSYINFIFVNGAVIIPEFSDSADAEARSVFERVFPQKEVITFPAREIVLGGGGLHCITKNY